MKEAWIHASYVSAYIKIHTYCMMAETNKSEVPLSLVKCLFIWLYCPRSGQLTHLQKRNDHMLKHFFFIFSLGHPNGWHTYDMLPHKT